MTVWEYMTGSLLASYWGNKGDTEDKLEENEVMAKA
jgi:hypothetical protein